MSNDAVRSGRRPRGQLGIVAEHALGGMRLVAERPFLAGETIAELVGVATPVQGQHTIQVGPDSHLAQLGLLAFINHSCVPSTALVLVTRELRALRELAAGEEITLFYPSTEWSIAEAFPCVCGHAGCLGLVRGAGDLEPGLLSAYFLNPHVIALLEASSKP